MMSIPLKDSPFRDTSPCSFAIESEGKILCVNTGSRCACEGCNEYEPVRNFTDNIKSSFRPSWIRVEDDTCYSYHCSRCNELMPSTQYVSEYYSRYCPSCGHKLYVEGEDVTNIEPGVYKHFKGRYYLVIGVAQHSETSENVVVYEALYGNYKLYVRPLSMFTEDIEDLSYHYRGPRFYKLEDLRGDKE